MIKEVILNKTGNHAIVVDEHDSQWFCHHIRKDGESVSDYLIDVYLYFIHHRSEFFNCDTA